jgi:hypothetical protein
MTTTPSELPTDRNACDQLFGLRILATDPKVLERPLFVAELHKPEVLHAPAPPR